MTKVITKLRSKVEAQIFCEFLYKEGHRHGDDIRQIIADLRELELKWGVKPKGKYIGRWIKV